MRKVGTLLLVAIVFSVVVGLYAAEREVTLTGTLVDSKCYLADNSNTGNDHMGVKGCGTICLKGGQPGALLTKDKKFYPILASTQVLAPYVGQEIRARGTLHSGAILPNKVEVSQNGKWEEVKLGTMM
jgi:hypothetical protein